MDFAIDVSWICDNPNRWLHPKPFHRFCKLLQETYESFLTFHVKRCFRICPTFIESSTAIFQRISSIMIYLWLSIISWDSRVQKATGNLATYIADICRRLTFIIISPRYIFLTIRSWCYPKITFHIHNCVALVLKRSPLSLANYFKSNLKFLPRSVAAFSSKHADSKKTLWDLSHLSFSWKNFGFFLFHCAIFLIWIHF